MQPQLHLDSADGIFLTRELEAIDEEIFDIAKVQIKGLEFVPLTGNNVAPEDEVYTQRQREYVGKARRLFHGSDEELPSANVKYTEGSVNFASYGDSFFYTNDEIRSAKKTGRPLDRDRAEAARRVLEVQLDDIIALGDSDAGLSGFINLSGTSTYSTPAGASTIKGWPKKTALEILADLNGMCSTVRVATGDLRNVKRILLPINAYDLIDTTPWSTLSDRTILSVFKSNRPGVEVMSWERLTGQGASSSDRAIGYDPNPSLMGLLLPVPFEQTAPQLQGFSWKVWCRNKTGGVIAREPKSIVVADHIMDLS